MQIRGSLALLLLAAFLTACSNDMPPPPQATESVQTEPNQSAGIAWFQGSIDDAFAKARDENKPLFVYWGAEWCPYCKELEANIFIRDEFVGLSQQFVTLDMSNGESETIRSADKFKIYGLPTVIVFNPSGEELTRIPGGMDMEQYAAVLELTLDNIRPVSDLVQTALEGGSLDTADWALLANYSWGQDRGQALGEESPSQVLLDLLAVAPVDDALTSSRLSLAAMAVWLGEDEEARDPELGAVHLAAVKQVLSEATLAQANLMLLAAYGSDIVAFAPDGEKDGLQASLLKLYQPAVEDESMNLLNRASVLAGWAEVAVAQLEEGESLHADRIDWATHHADQLLAELDAFQVHAGVNSLWGVYYDLGREEQARATLAMGIERSRAPFYFMSGMGYVELEAGNNPEALAWYRKAWESTSKPLDRSRWGWGYLRRVIKLAPEDTGEVARSASLLLADLLSQADGIVVYERRLGGMGESLLTWSEDSAEREAVVVSLRDQMAAHCEGLSEDGSVPAPCTEFLM